MTDNFDITVSEGEDKEFATDVVDIIDQTAVALGKPFTPRVVNFRCTDADGQLLGGLVGSENQGWLFVKLLAVAPEARNGGMGAALLKRAEAVARERKLAGVYLDTFEFQAPRFYLREGYTEIGRLPAVGAAPQRIWFAKTF